MNILVINGSPKGKYSTTLQTSLYLEILHPEHHFTYLNAGAQIRLLEKDFSTAEAALQEADLIVFSYPVYTFLVPSQLHRFIELVKEHQPDLRGKYATQISTSKHFYDITAHAFIRDNCGDLGLKYIKGLSADMDDLTHAKGQQEAEDFFRYVLWCVENGVHEPLPAEDCVPAAAAAPVSAAALSAGAASSSTAALSAGAVCPAAAPSSDAAQSRPQATVPVSSLPSGGKPGDVVIVADLAPEDAALQCMIDRFRAVFPRRTRLVNIHDFPFKGGCISCFHCSTDGTCIYKDGFSDLLRNQIQTAEAIVLAFTIRDHSMGSRFKTYDDRQFCNGHRTVTMGMPFGYLVCGDLPAEENLRTVIEARADVGGNFLAGIGSDATDPDTSVDTMAARLNYAIEQHYAQPQTFYGIGGMKIFRDLIWLMQGMMKADHRFYKSHGQYDFPQKKAGTMLAMYLVGGIMANPKAKAKMGSKMNEGMIAPYQAALKKARKRMEK